MSTVDIVVRPRSLKTRPYRNLSLGLVDATVVAATEMLTETKLATLDRLRPAHTEALTTALSSSASRVIASATEGLERRPQGLHLVLMRTLAWRKRAAVRFVSDDAASKVDV